MGERTSQPQRRMSFGRRVGGMIMSALAMLFVFGKNTKTGKTGLVHKEQRMSAGLPPEIFGTRYKPNQKKIRKKLRNNPGLRKSKKFSSYK
jgi:hypothetical protein